MEVWPWSLENPEAGFYSAWVSTVPPENATGDLKAFYDSAVNRASGLHDCRGPRNSERIVNNIKEGGSDGSESP